MNNQEREEKIQEAIEWAEANGWTIKKHWTASSEKKCCCPMGAVALKNNPGAVIGLTGQFLIDVPKPILKSGFQLANEALGTESEWAWSFGWGFDGKDSLFVVGTQPIEEAYNLGRKFAEKIIENSSVQEKE